MGWGSSLINYFPDLAKCTDPAKCTDLAKCTDPAKCTDLEETALEKYLDNYSSAFLHRF